jgi:hypothetical protein
MTTDIPDDKKLRAMSDAGFQELLAQCQPDAEKRRQDASPVQSAENSNPVPDRAAKPLAKIPNDNHGWHEKPLGKIWLTLVGGLLVVLTLFVLRNHLGLPL